MLITDSYLPRLYRYDIVSIITAEDPDYSAFLVRMDIIFIRKCLIEDNSLLNLCSENFQ